MNTKFFTGEGDCGAASVGGKKIPKDDPVFVLLGDTDELVSWLGFVKVEAARAIAGGTLDMAAELEKLQNILFILQAEIARLAFGYPASEKVQLRAPHLEAIEALIREIDVKLPQIKQFTVPGGSVSSAALDVARAVARRVERSAVLYHEKHELPQIILQITNRLSSALFALARYANHAQGIEESHPNYE